VYVFLFHEEDKEEDEVLGMQVFLLFQDDDDEEEVGME
jgi:hypothetical protein